MLYSFFALHFGQEDHLSPAVDSQHFEGFEVSDLHSHLGVEHIGSLPHELSRLHISLRQDELALCESSLLGCA